MGSAASTRMSLPQNTKSIEEDPLEYKSLGFAPQLPTSLPAQKIIESISENTEQNSMVEILNFVTDMTSLNDFGKLLQQLNLSSNEIESKITLFKENSKLHEVLMLATVIVVNLYDTKQSWTDLLNSLRKLDIFYHEIELEDRKLIGEYLSSIRFTKESFKTYQTILKKEELDSFDDRLLNNEIPVEENKLLLMYLIRGLWWNFSDVSCDFCFKLAEDGILKELVKDLKKLIGKKEDELKDSFCFESCLGVLHNSAKNDNLRPLYRKYKVVDILVKFFIYENLSKVMMLVLITLALIIDENQTHLLTSNETVFDLILSILKSSLQTKEHRFDGFSTQELLVSLTKLCRNDEVKRVLVKKNVLDLVLSVLNNEADYAFKKQKSIVPLLMQNKYIPDGWLGFLLGSKIFYEFTGKYDFNSKLRELIKEIGNRGKITERDEVDMAVATFQQPLGTIPHAVSQKFTVQDWIAENKLSELAHISKLSCENLLFLKNVSFRAPEFYFSLILDLISGKMTAKELTSLMMVHTAIERIKS
ncbi:hypothetical protein Btru_026264 [Bulinus truncatus]|nr:hypothetical protein Btru_026264 [Bulinus truncatus]